MSRKPYPRLVGDYVFDHLPPDARQILRTNLVRASDQSDGDAVTALCEFGMGVANYEEDGPSGDDLRAFCEDLAIARVSGEVDQHDWLRVLERIFNWRYMALVRALYEEGTGFTDAELFDGEPDEIIGHLDRQKAALRNLGFVVPRAHASEILVALWANGIREGACPSKSPSTTRLRAGDEPDDTVDLFAGFDVEGTLARPGTRRASRPNAVGKQVRRRLTPDDVMALRDWMNLACDGSDSWLPYRKSPELKSVVPAAGPWREHTLVIVLQRLADARAQSGMEAFEWDAILKAAFGPANLDRVRYLFVEATGADDLFVFAEAHATVQ